MSDVLDKINESWEKIEEMLRVAFQAGVNHGAVVYGEATTLNDPPATEDEFILKAKQHYLTTVIVRMGEEALKQHHPSLADSLLHKEAEASVRLDGETHVVEDTNG